jgi:hypothetical protein
MTDTAELLLAVPLIGQQHGYDGRRLMQPKGGKLLPHGRMACWYAAAEMVSKYHRPGPRVGLPAIWEADSGLLIQQINSLAKSEGLRVVPRPGTVDQESLLRILKQYGPIWAAGTFGGSGHVIVLTGVSGEQVHFNDPWEPSKKVKSITWFGNHLGYYPNALLAKDPTRS